MNRISNFFLINDDLENLKEMLNKNQFDVDIPYVITDLFDLPKFPIPILHYSIIQHSIKCFKFLLLNGSDPLTEIERNNHFQWDCRGLIGAFFEYEMLKILFDRGISFHWQIVEGFSMTFRNKLMINAFNDFHEFITEHQIPHFLAKEIESNNIEGVNIILNQCQHVYYQNA